MSYIIILLSNSNSHLAYQIYHQKIFQVNNDYTEIKISLSLNKLLYYESFINGNSIKPIVMPWNHIILML